jgi:hypothetical protein
MKQNQSNWDPTVWGPPFWFFLHTIAMTYPLHPNTGTKKKYYDFLYTMLPLFLPVSSMSSYYQQLLQSFPVTPYLDSRDDLVRWMHFIHNKVNQRLEKPEISLAQFYEYYYAEYQPKEKKVLARYKWIKKCVYMILVLLLCFLGYYFYQV